MGMSASQARLLTLTARMSDLELQAQQITNRKIRLSTDSQSIAEKYSNALNDKKLVFNKTNTSVTANNLTAYTENSLEAQRILKDSSGKIFVSAKIKEAYDTAGPANLEAFLSGVLGGIILESRVAKGRDLRHYVEDGSLQQMMFLNSENKTLISVNLQRKLGDFLNGDGSFVNPKLTFQEFLDKIGQHNLSNPNSQWYNPEMLNYHRNFYESIKEHGSVTYPAPHNATTLLPNGPTANYPSGYDDDWYIDESPEWLESKLNSGELRLLNSESGNYSDFKVISTHYSNDPEVIHYTNLYNAIVSAGGCSTVSDQSLLNNSSWLLEQLSNGNLFIEKWDAVGGESGNGTFESISYGTDTLLIEEYDTSNDAAAEAEYQAQTAKIQVKDKKMDNELKQIETEHKALETEYESVKKVIDKNIERSFKIFG